LDQRGAIARAGEAPVARHADSPAVVAPLEVEHLDLFRVIAQCAIDIVGAHDPVDQCRAAIDLCTGIPAARKRHFECPEVGHYGIFNGSRFRREIAPRIAEFARLHDPRTERGAMLPALKVDDYAGRNVAGKVVVFLGARGPKGGETPENRRLLGGRSRYATDVLKAMATIGPPAWLRSSRYSEHAAPGNLRA